MTCMGWDVFAGSDLHGVGLAVSDMHGVGLAGSDMHGVGRTCW